MVRTKWYGQNGSGQNGTDKVVGTKWYMDKMSLDKMVWTKWYGQHGTDKMVSSFGIDYNSSEINTYLVTKSHKQRKRHRGNVTEETFRGYSGSGIDEKIILTVGARFINLLVILSVPFYS